MPFDTTSIKRGIVAFWAIWTGIVFSTNVFDGLKAADVLGDGWSYASGNWGYMLDVTSVHDTPTVVVGVLFVGVLVWEFAATVLFVRAYTVVDDIGDEAAGPNPVTVAFFISLALWAAFMLASEIFVAYEAEATHRRIFTSQLLSLVALFCLPD